MNYVLKILFMIYISAQLIIKGNIIYTEIIIFLIIISANIFFERFYNSIYVLTIELFVIVYSVTIEPYFGIMYGVIGYDLVRNRQYKALIPLTLVVLYTLKGELFLNCTFIYGICIITAYITHRFNEEQRNFRKINDEERRYRYELESTKERLVQSSKEVANLAEVKERNRIAREIHDSVGHSIAGILMQLQASYKLREKDSEQSGELLKKSINGLSEALALLRDTVHNIRPKQSLGIQYIKDVVENFKFCEVELNYSGDFNCLPVNYFEIISANIKEALTNASRYSNASLVTISIEINEKYVRLYIKDNGVGCKYIKEGLGVSGMKERIKNIGGNISISTQDGFLIVCILPLKM